MYFANCGGLSTGSNIKNRSSPCASSSTLRLKKPYRPWSSLVGTRSFKTLFTGAGLLGCGFPRSGFPRLGSSFLLVFARAHAAGDVENARNLVHTHF